jgi:putative secretion ATPase (PEP-CTERM system associated)
MYERFYNLRERPFALSPDPDYLYPSRVHTEALSYLRYGIEGRAGFVVITGEIGCGKTTLLQTALRRLDRQTSVSRLVSTALDARELVEAVMLDFGLDPVATHSKSRLLRDLGRFLVEQRSAGRLALLVIDEAQNLSLSALEEVRMLSNLETEKSKLMQIVLVGQPNLRDLLQRPELEQLRQRVTVSYHVRPLDAEATFGYVNHRLKRAAIGVPRTFPRDVTDLVHQYSGGVGRRINLIADAILLCGYSEGQQTIDINLTRMALDELQENGLLDAPSDDHSSHSSGTPAAAPVAMDPADSVIEREARVARQEQRLAEQQRMLVEAYQLLRSQRDKASPPEPVPAPAAPLPTPAPTSSRVDTRSHRILTERPAPDGFWTRVRGNLFGIPSRPLEE